MRIAVIRNPKSSRNKGRPAPQMPDGVASFEPLDLEALFEVLRSLHQDGIDLLVIDGGDGTVRDVLSCLFEIFTDKVPMLTILANGNTNLIARKAGFLANLSVIGDLVHKDVSEFDNLGQTMPILRADVEGSKIKPLRGFIAGWGAYASATQIAMQEVGARGGGQVLLTYLTTLRRALIGREARGLREGVVASFDAQGHEMNTGHRFIGIATTLPGRLTAGLKPFWGKGEGGIRWLDVIAPAHMLALAAPLAVLGFAPKWMKRSGYHSGRSENLTLQIDGPIVLDGELFEFNSDQKIIITASETVRFIAI